MRAAETARIAAQHARPRGRDLSEALRGGPFDALGLAAGRGDVLLVGHEPDFSDELARLTGARAKLKKGGLADRRPGELKALLRPLDLAAIAATG